MATADLITELNTDLKNAYTAVSSKGGIVPANKNSNNLASAINSIDGGGSSPQYPYNIPEFDGGQYGAVAYLKDNGDIGYYAAENKNDLFLTDAYNGYAVEIKDLGGGAKITKGNLLAYSVGSQYTGLPNNFLTYCVCLQNLFGVDKITSIGSNFLYRCYSFNQPMIFENLSGAIPGSFLNDCYSLNQPITLNAGVTSINYAFMQGCYSYNKQITIPNTVTSIGNTFLESCGSYNQPLTIPEGVTSIGSDFLRNATSFNQILSLPSTLQTISTYFMGDCSFYNQNLTIPSSITAIGSSFMKSCSSFEKTLTVNTSVSPTDDASLSSSSYAPSYVTGITLAGTGATAWKTALPDLSSGSYRKLILAEETA